MIFFIPLGTGSHWQNNELKYLLRSLEGNFKENFDVVCYWDEKPNLNIKGKHIDRWYPEQALTIYSGVRHFENYFDVLKKVELFINSKDCSKVFLFAYDDILLVKSITKTGIFNTPQFRSNDVSRTFNEKTKWGRTVNSALKLSGGDLNFEHHLPMIYKRDKLKEIFDKYPLKDLLIPYSLATLYFNIYPEEINCKVLPEDYKCGFEGIGGLIGRKYVYPQNKISDIDKAIEGKTWVNYNDEGLEWNKGVLKQWIKDKFKKNSKFEI